MAHVVMLNVCYTPLGQTSQFPLNRIKAWPHQNCHVVLVTENHLALPHDRIQDLQ